MTQSEIVRRIDEICHEFDSRLVSGVSTPVARLELAKALAETESALGDVLIKHNASLEALEQLRAENAALKTFVTKLASHPCENFTAGWNCNVDGRTATAEDYADRMCIPCQARELLAEADKPAEAENRPCKQCGQTPNGQGGEYPCSVCGIPTLHDAINGCAHRAPVPAGDGKMVCHNCGLTF